MSEQSHIPVVIMGGGPAGLTAAIYAVRSGMTVRVIERGAPGGQMFMIDRIENYPGFPNGVSGPDLSDRMRDQAVKLGAEIVQDPELLRSITAAVAGAVAVPVFVKLAAILPNPVRRSARNPGPGVRRLAGTYAARAQTQALQRCWSENRAF